MGVQEILGKSTALARPAACVDSCWKRLRHKSWVGQGVRESPGRENGVSQVDGELRFGTCLCLPLGRGKDSAKEQWCLPALLSPEGAALTPAPTLAPPALALQPVSSAFPRVLLQLFQLLPLHRSLE